jgi:hypothetical protein
MFFQFYQVHMTAVLFCKQFSDRSLQSLLLRVAFGLVAFGGKAVSRSVWESAGGKIRRIPDLLEYSSSMATPSTLVFSSAFRDKHPKIIKFVQSVALLPGCAWKVRAPDAPDSGCNNASTTSVKSRKLLETQHQIEDMEAAFTCVRRMSKLRRVGVCHRYFALPPKGKSH